MSLEQGGFGLCLIKAALRYLDICYICILWVKGSAQASEACTATTEPFFPLQYFS